MYYYKDRSVKIHQISSGDGGSDIWSEIKWYWHFQIEHKYCKGQWMLWILCPGGKVTTLSLILFKAGWKTEVGWIEGVRQMKAMVIQVSVLMSFVISSAQNCFLILWNSLSCPMEVIMCDGGKKTKMVLLTECFSLVLWDMLKCRCSSVLPSVVYWLSLFTMDVENLQRSIRTVNNGNTVLLNISYFAFYCYFSFEKMLALA